MKIGRGFEFALNRPRFVVAATALVTIVLVALAAVPSLWPERFPNLNSVRIDTDPENMLDEREPVRIVHDEMKRAFSMPDMIVVGVVNDRHPEGVFNVETLRKVYEFTSFSLGLQGERLGLADPRAGVVASDLIAPGTVDNIEQAGPGTVRFEWLMSTPPATDEEAAAVRDKARRIPFLDGTLVSEDGRAIAIYLPITAKNLAHDVYVALNEKIDAINADDNGDRFLITGLPVAEETFGVEMFKQMAISAPMAMLVIFLLLLFFFRRISLAVPPMILAMVSVAWTMSALVIAGKTIHIMSSMIPIFIMPIAVLDSVHILSEFFDRYQTIRDRRETVRKVLDELFWPMLYTSLTSAAGFASLALTPIPPVQVFGVFVAAGIMAAWLLTMTFFPAAMLLIPERWLENFGARADRGGEGEATLTGRFLRALDSFTWHHAKLALAAGAILLLVGAYGISLIRINDNPTRWFEPSHPIRVADRILNDHFGGTYMAFLSLHPVGERPKDLDIETAQPPLSAPVIPAGLELGEPGLPSGLDGEDALSSDTGPAAATTGAAIFKSPEVLEYVAGLQDHLARSGVVGKSNSIVEIVKTVHRELIDGSAEAYRVPETATGVAQTLMQYQSSHRPDDLWHFVTPDYRHASIWLQMKSGDNVDMSAAVEAAREYIASHPPRFEIDGEAVTLEPDWFGMTYLNVVWQEKMVWGMLYAFLGSFVIVFLMMLALFRSPLLAVLSMLPLAATIGIIYGAVGLAGKDYDMPVAVLSALALGLAVDFAIHFIARSRALYAGSWDETRGRVFGEPARAILRNVIVIAVGFLPLLAAPLVPYQTVGFLMAAILLLSGAATLVILPALMRILDPALLRAKNKEA